MRTLLLSAALLLVGCAEKDATEDDDGGSVDDTSSAGGDEDDGEVDDSVDCETGLEVGDCAPDFTMQDADGDTHSLSDFQGQTVVILGTAEW